MSPPINPKLFSLRISPPPLAFLLPLLVLLVPTDHPLLDDPHLVLSQSEGMNQTNADVLGTPEYHEMLGSTGNAIEKVGLVYPTRVSMDRATIQVEGRQMPLSPGMAVKVEIERGQWRV